MVKLVLRVRMFVMRVRVRVRVSLVENETERRAWVRPLFMPRPYKRSQVTYKSSAESVTNTTVGNHHRQDCCYALIWCKVVLT